MRHLQKPVGTTSARPMAPRQLVIAFEQPQLWLMPVTDRQRIVVSLASLLMQAAGDVAETEEEENGDDER